MGIIARSTSNAELTLNNKNLKNEHYCVLDN